MKKFTMIDESFTCIVCGQDINPLGYTARDHCPHCLSSIHVDNNPGDRQNQCHGVLEPIEIDTTGNKYKIIYKCQKCQLMKKNLAAIDDNLDTIINVMNKLNK